jgi:predicted nucleic acid-binding protein
MTGNKVLLDTNIISALLKGDVEIANQIDESIDRILPLASYAAGPFWPSPS